MLIDFFETLEGDDECQASFGIRADDAGDAAELFVEREEQFRKIEDIKLGGEAIHGLLMRALAFEDAVVADVGAAKAFPAQSDSPAEFA